MTGQEVGFFTGQAKLPQTLEQIEEAKIPRDQYDRPLIWPVGTGPTTHDKKDMLPYARASSYGGQLEDKSALELWGKRQMIRGVAIDVDRWRAEMAEVHRGQKSKESVASTIIDRVPQGEARVRGGEPDWRAKRALNLLAGEADTLVGSQDKAALGTAIHLVTEIVDQGGSLDGFGGLLVERANAYYRARKDWGLTYTAIERFGVEDENQVAGTTDRCGYVPWVEPSLQQILDVKTSGTMDFAGIGFAVQLATYARMFYYDAETGERTAHENMNLEKAGIIHVSRELGGPVEFFEVDIRAGWEYAKLARQVIVARRVGKKSIREVSEMEMQIGMCQTLDELGELYNSVGGAWNARETEIATEVWNRLAAQTPQIGA